MTSEPDRWMLRETGARLAEKHRLSMAMPWAPPWLSAANQTSHKAAPGGQLMIGRLLAARLTWFVDWVPSRICRPLVLMGKLTFRLGAHAVTFVESRFVAVDRKSTRLNSSH